MLLCAVAITGCQVDRSGGNGADTPQDKATPGEGRGLHAERDLPSEVRPPAAFAAGALSLATAGPRTFPTSLQVPAEIAREAGASVPIRAPVDGRVVHLGANAGDRVRRRGLLVMLESDVVAGARAAYRLAQEQAAEARSTGKGIESAEAAVHAARQRLIGYRVAPDQRSEQRPGHPGHVSLRSPASGQVLHRLASLGQEVRAGDVLLELTGTDLLSIRAEVPERALGALRVGQRVEVHVGHAPAAGELIAEVTAISPIAGTPAATLRGVVISRASGWIAGARATLLVPEAGAPASFLAIPVSAVQKIHGRPFAFVPAPSGSFEARPLRLGDREQGFVQVHEGVEPGEQVVAGGAVASLAGQLVAAGRSSTP